MLELAIEPRLAATLVGVSLKIQDEPSLDMAMPQVFHQERLTVIQRGKLPHLEALVARMYQHHLRHPAGALGQEVYFCSRDCFPRQGRS